MFMRWSPRTVLITALVYLGALTGFAATPKTNELAALFPRIVVDVRGARGGKGDVAAGYLMGADLVQRLGYDGHLTLLVDSDGLGILSKLRGAPVAVGEQLFDGHVAVTDVENIRREPEPYSLYLGLASPSGTLRYEKDMDFRAGSRLAEGSIIHEGIPLSDESVVLVQTVLGNTENPNSRNPFALMRVGDESLSLDPAGLGGNESGIYWDPVAASLREAQASTVQQFVEAAAETLVPGKSRDNILGILQSRILRNSRVGLVYGITHRDVRSQFMGYLEGAVNEARILSRGIVLLTPSGFSAEYPKSYPRLRNRVAVYDSVDDLPQTIASGHVAVVKTGALPHSLFVGLMAHSSHQGVTPVVAGDGSMSAAIILGIPFVMTRVGWNSSNIANLREILIALTRGDPRGVREQRQRVIRDVFDDEEPNLEFSSKLSSFKNAFRLILAQVPYLSHQVFIAASRGKELIEGKKTLDEMLAGVRDQNLQSSLRRIYALQRIGEIDARRFASYLRSHLGAADYVRALSYLATRTKNPHYSMEFAVRAAPLGARLPSIPMDQVKAINGALAGNYARLYRELQSTEDETARNSMISDLILTQALAESHARRAAVERSLEEYVRLYTKFTKDWWFFSASAATCTTFVALAGILGSESAYQMPSLMMGGLGLMGTVVGMVRMVSWSNGSELRNRTTRKTALGQFWGEVSQHLSGDGLSPPSQSLKYWQRQLTEQNPCAKSLMASDAQSYKAYAEAIMHEARRSGDY